MTVRPVIIIGNLTIDDVIQPDGSSQMGTLGGNSVHAAAAALTWTGDVGVVARCGADFPAAALDRLREAGADTGGIRPIDGPTVRNWVIYEADGTRNWVYRTPRDRSAEVAPRPGDIPDAWLDRMPAPVVHVAAMPLAAATAIVRSIRERAGEAIITLDTHEDWPPRRRRCSTPPGWSTCSCRRARNCPSWPGTTIRSAPRPSSPRRGDVRRRQARRRRRAGSPARLAGRRGCPPRPPRSSTRPARATASAAGSPPGSRSARTPAEAAWRGCVTAAAAIGAVGSLRLLDRGRLARDLLAGRASADGPVSGTDGGERAGDGRIGGGPAGGGRPRCAATAELGLAESGQAGARLAEGGQDDYGIETMHREIATIPDVIAGSSPIPAATCGSWRTGWPARGIEHLYLTGCGDSAFAGLAATLAFRRHSRLRVHAVHALDLARYDVRYLPPASAVLAISYSGKVGRTIEAALQAAAFGVSGHRADRPRRRPAGRGGRPHPAHRRAHARLLPRHQHLHRDAVHAHRAGPADAAGRTGDGDAAGRVRAAAGPGGQDARLVRRRRPPSSRPG